MKDRQVDEFEITGNFLKNLSRGGVKSIPLAGAFLEQMIYGTLDGEEAREPGTSPDATTPRTTITKTIINGTFDHLCIL